MLFGKRSAVLTGLQGLLFLRITNGQGPGGPQLPPQAPDGWATHPAPLRWTALGDSYTAAPGAGATYNNDGSPCYKHQGSYAFQLSTNFPFTGDGDMQFIACTGYTTEDLLTNTIGLIEQDQRDLMVLSIGGNDVGFGEIAKKCLYGLGLPGSCQGAIDNANTVIESDDFKSHLMSVYSQTFAKMAKEETDQVYQILYPRFFHVEADNPNEWCNTHTLGLDLVGPDLPQQFRITLNDLSDKLNAKIAEIANYFIYTQSPKSDGHQYYSGAPGWRSGRRKLIILDTDQLDPPLFDGHRFCEAGAEAFDIDSIWFFSSPLAPDVPPSPAAADTGTSNTAKALASQLDAKGCSGDARYKSDPIFEYECDIAQLYASNGTDFNVIIPTVAGDAKKPFHPRTDGYTAQMEVLYKVMQEIRHQYHGECAPINIADYKPPPALVTDLSATFSTCSLDIVGASATATLASTSTSSETGTVTGASWTGPGGTMVPASQFAVSIVPQRSQDATVTLQPRAPNVHVRAVAPPPPPPANTPVAKNNATLMIFAADTTGSSTYTTHGPFNINCNASETVWQLYSGAETGQEYDLSVQSGHSCATLKADYNYDGLHLAYTNQYLDVPAAMNTTPKNCTTTTNGVFCFLNLP